VRILLLIVWVVWFAVRGFAALDNSASGKEQPSAGYPAPIAVFLERLCDAKAQRLAFHEDYPGGFKEWQSNARTALHSMLGMDRIAAAAGEHRPKIELGRREDCGDYTRQSGVIETEPGVRIPFWVLRPKRGEPWPLGVFPHGHDSRGHDTTAGVFADADHEQKSLAEDRDVAVQAAKRGFLSIAPAIRGVSAHVIPDLNGRHGERDCRSQVMHCLLVGRTAMGERVWDMERILDWALTLPEVDGRRVLMMGNSGGGMVTMFTSACDRRVSVAVPSCSFAPSVSSSGYVFHCDCNIVPGLLDLGGLPGVVGLIAPRPVLAVNGRKDTLLWVAEVERAAVQTRAIYSAAGAPEALQHRWGEAGHRFYKDLMWPFVLERMQVNHAATTNSITPPSKPGVKSFHE
jgi:dienelactone hydrolase